MTMNKKEEAIKEKRTREAVNRNLMGLNGKLGIICQHLGSEIMQDGGGMYESSDMDDVWLLEGDGEDKLPTMEEGGNIIGYIFDGLNMGFHLEIKYLDYRKELNCYHKGHEVYKEVSGELEAYAPYSAWEEMVEHLFKRA